MIKKLIVTFFILFNSAAHAETIDILVGFPPGGGQHIIGLLIEESLRELGYKTQLITKPGAGGVIAMNECVKKADSNTLCLTTQSQTVHSMILSPDAVKYDPNNLNYIKLLGESPMVMLTNISNTKTLNEILLDIKTNKVSFASGALGNTQAALMLIAHLKAQQAIDVSYKGVGPAISDLIGGHVTYVLAPYTAAKHHIDNGTVRLAAILDDSSYITNVPRIAGFSVPPTRFGIVASPNLDSSAVKAQTRILTILMAHKKFHDKLREQGIFVPSINYTGDDYKAMTLQERKDLLK